MSLSSPADTGPFGPPTNRPKPADPGQKWIPVSGRPGIWQDTSNPPRLKTWINTSTGKPLPGPPA